MNPSFLKKLLVVILGATLVWSCDGPEEREAAHLKKGVELFESGDFVKARLEFRNVLQINPLSVEGLYHFGLVDEASGNLRQAFVDFSKVVEQDPNHAGALVKLGQYALLSGDLDTAKEHAESVLSTNAKHANALALRAAINLREQDLVAAREYVDLALEADANNKSAISILVGIYRQQGDFEQAILTLDEAIQANPSELDFRRLKIQLLAKAEDWPNLEMEYRALGEIEQDDIEIKVNIAKALLAQGRVDDAESFLRDNVVNHPSEPVFKILLVDFLITQRTEEVALGQLESLIEQSPDQHELKIKRADLLLRSGKEEEALSAYTELSEVEDHPQTVLTAFQQKAKIFVSKRNYEAADEMLEQALALDPRDAEALFLRAAIAAEAAEYDSAIADLRTLLRDAPDNAQAWQLLAEVYDKQGSNDLAVEAYSNVLDLDPTDIAVRLSLVRQLALRGHLDEVLRHTQALLTADPKNQEALTYQMKAHGQKKLWAEVVKDSTDIIELTDDKSLGYFARAQANLALGEYQMAIEDYDAAAGVGGDADRALVGKTRSYLASNRIDEAISLIRAEVKKNPDDAKWPNMLGEIYLASGSVDRAITEFESSAKIDPNYTTAFLNWGTLLIKADNVDEAAEVFSTGHTNNPDSVEIQMALANIFILQERFDDAIDLYEGLIGGGNSSAIAANNLAALIADYQYDDSGRLQVAMDAVAPYKNSSNPLLLDTIGWVQFRLGDVEQALDYLTRASAQDPSNAQIQYHLGMAYHAANDLEKAKAALEIATRDVREKYPGLQQAQTVLESL